MARFLVGIDLGTTNSAVAFVDRQHKHKAGPKPQTFPVAQVVAAGEVAALPLLPSFLYVPGPHDLPAGSLKLPWDEGATEAVGTFARNHGAKVPGRLVSSAKSWLCHPGVDRTAPLLPWGAPPEVPRLSPLEVSAKYLRSIVLAWNHAPHRKPEDRLEELPVVLTVPASFDDVARNLTAEAAKLAGLRHVTLLEEPQAAFYAWLGTHTPEEAGKLKPGMRCLVVDVGGGTTDLSLIRVGEDKGEITFEREAVGDHLLLGGDNMDLALAKAVEGKFPAGRLDATQFGALIQACRQAKEALLAETPPARYPVTVVGRGRAVVAGTVSVDLTPDDVKAVLFDGFFPPAAFDAEPARAGRAGLQEMGLPYVADPAISKHLAAFLRQHLADGNARGADAARSPAIDAILFNGGVFTPRALQDRVVEVMRPWFGPGWSPLVLTTPSLDLAVAWGAAYFNHLKQSGGRRIGGGIPRSYYLGIEAGGRGPGAGVGESSSESPLAPRPSPLSVLCVVPRRMQEGEEVALPEPELELQLGQPVLFPLYTSTARGDDRPGEVIRVAPEQLLDLPPLHTVLRGGKRAGAKRVPVTLAAKYTEIGTLELYCVSREGNRWRLEFNVRDVTRERAEPAEEADRAAVVHVFPEEKVQAAGDRIRAAFLPGVGAVTPQQLPRELEAAVESGRANWPTGLCRRLWDFLAEVADHRARSPAHLSRWYNLAGFCLRPGFGDPLDRYRVEALWKLVTAAAAAKGPAAAEGGADYWIMWRRAGGGLNAALQQTLFTKLRPVLLPPKGKPAPRPGMNELTEMWRAAASLERLDTRTKQQLAERLLDQLKRPPVPPYLFWSLTRLGARRAFYGPLNSIAHPQIVEGWLTDLLEFRPQSDNDRLGWGFCLAQLARRTDMRGLDIGDDTRREVTDRLRSADVPNTWPRMVEEVVTEDTDEQSRLFGEALPIGLRLTGG